MRNKKRFFLFWLGMSVTVCVFSFSCRLRIAGFLIASFSNSICSVVTNRSCNDCSHWYYDWWKWEKNKHTDWIFGLPEMSWRFLTQSPGTIVRIHDGWFWIRKCIAIGWCGFWWVWIRYGYLFQLESMNFHLFWIDGVSIMSLRQNFVQLWQYEWNLNNKCVIVTEFFYSASEHSLDLSRLYALGHDRPTYDYSPSRRAVSSPQKHCCSSHSLTLSRSFARRSVAVEQYPFDIDMRNGQFCTFLFTCTCTQHRFKCTAQIHSCI